MRNPGYGNSIPHRFDLSMGAGARPEKLKAAGRTRQKTAGPSRRFSSATPTAYEADTAPPASRPFSHPNPSGQNAAAQEAAIGVNSVETVLFQKG